MVETVKGTVLGYGVQNNSFEYYYALVFQKDTGDKIMIRSKDVYPIDSYQKFNVKHIKGYEYMLHKKKESFLTSKIIMLTIGFALILGSFLFASNTSFKMPRPMFKYYLIFGGIACIAMAIGELFLSIKQYNRKKGENFTEQITSDVLNTYSLHAGRHYLYFAELSYYHNGAEHRCIKQLVGGVWNCPNRGDQFTIRIYKHNGLMADGSNVKIDIWANLIIGIFGVLALFVSMVF